MKTYATTILAALAVVVTTGCEQQQPGPAEKAGKQIDQAVEKAGQKTAAAAAKVEKYTEEKVKEAGQAIEKAGEKLQK